MGDLRRGRITRTPAGGSSLERYLPRMTDAGEVKVAGRVGQAEFRHPLALG
jgi:hypothetical protein